MTRFPQDPLRLAALLWPRVRFYKEQIEIIYSVVHDDETYVPAANMMGKDFVAGFIAISNFIIHPEVRIVTTSVKDDHLVVLWGEIGRFIETSVVPLTVDKGGIVVWNHRHISKVVVRDGKPTEERDRISYLKGFVSEKGEGMAGHHARWTLVIGDEASGIDNLVYTQSDTWAKRKLFIGNPNLGCTNFFFDAVEAGNVLEPPPRIITPDFVVDAS